MSLRGVFRVKNHIKAIRVPICVFRSRYVYQYV